jgi:hypothetical protein
MDYTQELHAIAMIWAALIAIAVASFALLRASCRELMMCAAVAVLTLAIPRLGAAQPIDVKETWLKRDCRDKGTLDHPTSNPEFEACLRKLIEPLPPLDKNRRELFGEQYDPSKYVACRIRPGNRTNSACDVYVLRRREWPEYWPEGAQKIKWPEGSKESVYRKGMTSKEYWEALCKAEAGEFVFRTMKDVEGVYHARPRASVTDQELTDRFVLEDPYFISDILGTSALEREIVQPYSGQYTFLETHLGLHRDFVRHERGNLSQARTAFQTARDGKWLRVPFIVDEKPVKDVRARYGFTWRGVQRVEDRLNGIAGSEFAIIDMRNGEILALRRGFAWDEIGAKKGGRFWWRSAARCPEDRGAPLRRLLYHVLQPPPDVNAAIKPIE